MRIDELEVTGVRRSAERASADERRECTDRDVRKTWIDGGRESVAGKRLLNDGVKIGVPAARHQMACKLVLHFGLDSHGAESLRVYVCAELCLRCNREGNTEIE